MRFVLVDDERDVRLLLGHLVALTGNEVVGESACGMDAVELVVRLDPDVVIMDLSLPGLNGADATRIIKKQRPEIEVIGFTAHADGSGERRLKAAGASEVYLKDNTGQLLDYLRSAFSTRRVSATA